MAKHTKTLMVHEFQKEFGALDGFVFVNYGGLNANQAKTLRATLHKSQVKFRVIKNTIARKALTDLGFTGIDKEFEGPTAIAYGADGAVSAAKALTDWRQKTKTLQIKGGVLSKKSIGPDQVQSLANLPSRPEMLSQLLGLIYSPVQDVANLLDATLASVPGLVQAHIEKKEKEGEGAVQS